MKRALLFLLVLGVAAAVGASNMGFKATISLPIGAASSSHWISLPYFYTPADAPSPGIPGVVDAEDLLQDMTNASTVFKFDAATGQKVGWSIGGYGTPFTLSRGEGYEVVNNGINTISFVCVGSHDPSYSFSLPIGAASSSHWVSIPYHWNPVEAPAPGIAGKDAEDLLQEMTNASTVFRFDPDTGQKVGWSIGGYGTPFAIDVFQGYEVVNNGANTITWTPSHF